MCILIQSKPPSFQSPQCTRHGKTFDTRISVSWLPDLDSYAVSVWQPGDLDSRISGFSSEVDLGSWSCLGLLLDEYICRLKSGGLLLTESCVVSVVWSWRCVLSACGVVPSVQISPNCFLQTIENTILPYLPYFCQSEAGEKVSVQTCNSRGYWRVPNWV